MVESQSEVVVNFDPLMIVVVAQVALALAWLAARLTTTIPGLWKTNERFNSTADWTPAALHEQPASLSRATSTYAPSLRIITLHLEQGETLEGFARGYFSPPRPRDWKPSISTLKCPLLIAVTSRRVLLFEVSMLDGAAAWTNPNELKVLGSCFIPLDAIQYLRPPKGGLMGTGRLRFGLVSGREYQMGFLSPLLNAEAMRQERRLAAYLREMAHRLPRSPVARVA